MFGLYATATLRPSYHLPHVAWGKTLVNGYFPHVDLAHCTLIAPALLTSGRFHCVNRAKNCLLT